MTIEGEFEEWEAIKNQCIESVSDSQGIGIGIIQKKIVTNFGEYQIKFLLIFLDSTLKHRISPINRFSIANIKKEGLVNILNTLGRKLITNLQRKGQLEI
jgi:hypothetical protein